MIVEDDRLIAEDIKITLEKFGFNVSKITGFGEEAVKLALAEQPDLVLMDIVLKGKMTGIEAASKIRAKNRIPIVYLTAYTDKKTIEKVKLTGPYGYIIKPFEDNELYSIIEIAIYKHHLESKMERINKILSTIWNNNKTIIKENDQNRLFRSICENLVKDGLYTNAWVALFDDSNNIIEGSLCSSDKKPRSITDFFKINGLPGCFKKLVKKPDLFIVKNQKFCSKCKLNKISADKNVMITPIIVGNNLYGGFGVTIPKGHLPDNEEKVLFNDLVNDVALAIHSLQINEARKLAEVALLEGKHRYETLFQESPISLWEEDFSVVLQYLNRLKKKGVTNLKNYFLKKPQELIKCSSMVKVIDVNKATLALYGATDLKDFRSGLDQVLGPEAVDVFSTELSAFAGGATTFETEAITRTLGGSKNQILLKCTILPGHEKDLDKVLVSIIDITARKNDEAKILRRDAILDAINFASGQFLRSSNWKKNIEEILLRIGSAVDVSRAYIVENFRTSDVRGKLIMHQRFEWCAPGINSQLKADEYQGLPYIQAGFGKWLDVLGSGEVLWGHTNDFPKNIQSIFRDQGIRSVIAVPIFVGLDWWGFIGCDECRTEREWTPLEIDGLRTAADVLGAAIQNYQNQDELMRLSTAVKMSTDCITLLDMDGMVIDINNAVLELFGTNDREFFIGKNYLDLMVPEERRRALENFKEIFDLGFINKREFNFKLASGQLAVVETTASLMRNPDGEPIGIVAVTRDITERKRTELEMKRRLMKYQLDEGYLYLFKESSLNIALDCFNDLMKVGYKGYVLSRTTKNGLRNKIKFDSEFIWLSETGKIDSILAEPGELTCWFNRLKRGSVVLLDRLDYIIHRNGFKKTLTFIQRLAELTYLNNHIILLVLDPGTINPRELRMLEKEAAKVKPMISVDLEEDLLETVKYIYEMNLVGMKPTFSQVEQVLKISKPTVRKRIADLKNRGLLIDLRKGSSKVVEITEKGKAIFKK